ncbi:hypothetical protein ACVI1L_003701 [Bradyrhizobium sp. USDA 4516]
MPSATLVGGAGSSEPWSGQRGRSLGASRSHDCRYRQPTASTTQAGGPRGSGAGKRLYGRTWHIVTDTNGILLAGQVHPAMFRMSVPCLLLEQLRERFPRLRHVFADRIYRGQLGCRRTLPLRAVGNRDCRAAAWDQGLPALAEALGCRAHLRLIRQMPTPCKRLRRLRRHRPGLASRRPSQAPDQTSRQTLKMLLAF